MSMMESTRSRIASDEILPLGGDEGDYDQLMEWIGDRHFVLLGEASHGTHEFYRERARITRRLIKEKGFVAVAVEADWPDAYRINRYVMGLSDDPDAESSVADFDRFPAWMWRNADVVDFIAWLRDYNEGCTDPARRARFYGIDLYSLRASMEAVVAYLSATDPEAARRAMDRYSCFDIIGGEGVDYGHAVQMGLHPSCEDEVVAQLTDLRSQSAAILRRDGVVAEDEFFVAEQNARVVHDAERYYRAMYQGRVSSWNLRDRHMAETLRDLNRHLRKIVGDSKIVVWEHNSHVGDARATELGRSGEFNVGELARGAWGDDCFLVGFTTYRGRVTAASTWGGQVERKHVRPALQGSFEDQLHHAPSENFVVRLGDHAPEPLRSTLLERAIGVIYRPETERLSHWFHATISAQFDALVHLDTTSAVHPLDRTPLWDAGEPPETYPTGL
ncbi:MAG TPA: erythromycin esterase family protein [Acidimicrobiales bacterium]|nr:erythromycin esterase family protein [Acidimicrobiales bacterium]